MKIQGAVALVTGGASGLGEATVRRLVTAGARVVIVDRDDKRGPALESELGERARFVKTDVTSPEDVGKAIDAATQLGGLRIAVSCAGVGWAARTLNKEGQAHDLELFKTVIGTNLIGTFNVTRLAAAAMAKQAPLDDGERGEDDHENADRRGGVAVRHLDPRLPVRDRAGGQRGLGPLDVRARAEGTGVAVAARPVGTAEARVAEPGEGAEQDQVEGEEEHEQREGAQPRRRRGTAPTRPEPGERRQREREAERGDAEERREVVARGRVVHRPARSQPAEARSSLSTSRFSFAGSASGGTRIIQSPRGSTR